MKEYPIKIFMSGESIRRFGEIGYYYQNLYILNENKILSSSLIS